MTPAKLGKNLKPRVIFNPASITRFLTFPFDQRFIYYVGTDKWLNEARADFARIVEANEFLLTVPEPRKVSETRPIFTTTLANLHVHERGSVAFPRETRGDDLLSDRDANIPEATWRVVRQHFGLSGERRDQNARHFVGRLFRVVFAVLHAPRYQADHKSALSGDWAHLPIPKDAGLFDRLADAGEQVTALLDANREAGDVVSEILGTDLAQRVGPLKRAMASRFKPAISR